MPSCNFSNSREEMQVNFEEIFVHMQVCACFVIFA